jgi:hypothetical protein
VALLQEACPGTRVRLRPGVRGASVDDEGGSEEQPTKTPIDALTSLAFSLYSGKGIYAILLGSGVSRAAEIPTGWEITMDLVRQIAALKHEACEPDPENWYASKFGKSPDYSVLLEQRAKTSAERTTVLAGYFEPSRTDRENGRKLPTKAHQQIAKLVANGYIKVIITTNFDRLMEQALEAEGVAPTVISTVDAIKGAMPLQHAACTVLKVHGDYRDTDSGIRKRSLLRIRRNWTSCWTEYRRIWDGGLRLVCDVGSVRRRWLPRD